MRVLALSSLLERAMLPRRFSAKQCNLAWSNVFTVQAQPCGPVPCAARRHDACGGSIVLRESTDRTRHGGDHAPRRPHSPRAYCCRVEPRPDAPEGLHAEGIDLVNIVRRPQHVELLRGIGAKHVVDSSLDSFGADLVETLTETGATLAFDATGGGDLPGRILAAMETAQTRLGSATTPYGSAVHKQLYIYGGLQRGPTVFDRAFGMAWGMGGWLLPIYLDRVGPEESGRMRQRVADEIKTTFASSYGKTVSLAEAVTPEAISRYGGYRLERST